MKGLKTKSLDFDVLILAGGLSRRMGADKASLDLAGKTLLEHLLAGAAAWGGQDILVSGPPRDWPQARYVPDAPGHPPSSLRGIYTGLLVAASPWVLVVGCDMPFVRPEVVSRLWQEKNAGGAVAKWHNRLQPLPGLYPRQGAAVIAELLAENRFHLAALLDHLQPAVVRDIQQVDPEGWSFFNINTPEELAAARERLESLGM